MDLQHAARNPRSIGFHRPRPFGQSDEPCIDLRCDANSHLHGHTC